VPSDISIGDVVRAWRTLDASSDEERREIARVLGFDLIARGAAPDAESAPSPLRKRDRTRVEADAQPANEPQPIATAHVPLDLVPFTDVRVNPIDVGHARLPRPEETVPAPLEPLFAPTWIRAIASTLVAHAAPVGEIILDRVIDVLALRMPLQRLPRRRRLVSASEVTVVIDNRGTLAWFRADADQLIAKIDATSRARVTILESEGAPSLAPTTVARIDESSLEDIEPAIRIGARGRVIAFTDLGVGSSWRAGDRTRLLAWQALGAALRGRGASLVIITPVPAERIPPALARIAPCVYWDRTTRPGTIRRRVKDRSI
jgi:hypothetical protein